MLFRSAQGNAAKENPFKKPYKPNRPTNLPPGVTVKESSIDPRATTDRIRAIQAELKQPVDSARRTALRAELEKLVADMETWQRAMPVKEAAGDDWFPVASQVSSDPNDVIPEVPDNFNPTIAYRKISLLRKELWRMQGLKYEERAKIVAEIRKLENQISLYLAQKQSEPGYGRTEPSDSDDGAPLIGRSELVDKDAIAEDEAFSETYIEMQKTDEKIAWKKLFSRKNYTNKKYYPHEPLLYRYYINKLIQLVSKFDSSVLLQLV